MRRIGINPLPLLTHGDSPTISQISEVLARSKQARFDFVELNQSVMHLRAEDIRMALEANGLSVFSISIGYESLLRQDRFSEAICYALEIGSEALTCLGQATADAETASRLTAEACNTSGLKCKENGLQFLYQGMRESFLCDADADHESLVDYLVSNTDPDLVGLTLDTLSIKSADKDPADLITRFKNRCKCIHLKDGNRVREPYFLRQVALSRGEVGIANCLAAHNTSCPSAYLVFDQDEGISPEADLVASREFLTTLGY